MNNTTTLHRLIIREPAAQVFYMKNTYTLLNTTYLNNE